jgi:hypothetical protein
MTRIPRPYTVPVDIRSSYLGCHVVTNKADEGESVKRQIILAWIAVMALMTVTCRLGGVIGDPPATVAPRMEDTAARESDATRAQPTPTQVDVQSSEPVESDQNGDEMPVDQRIAVLEEVTAFLNALSGEDRALDNADTAAYLASRSEFRAAGVSPDATVWGEFTDGRLLFVFNNLDLTGEGESDSANPNLSLWSDDQPHVPASWAPRTRRSSALGPDAPMAQETSVELPRSDQVRLVSAMGTFYEEYDAVPALGSLFARGNYRPAEGAEATVFGLKEVSGDGVFYLHTHGGLLDTADREPVYAVLTRTPINAFNETQLKSDIQAGRVVYGVAPHDRNPTYDPDRDPPGRASLWAYHYGITADFVREYMSFGENSFVYVRSCSSDHPQMRRAFLDKGAAAYAGWSQTVYSSGAYRTTMFLFDRLLGANEVAPIENPRQRPFDLDSVYANMRERGLHKVSGAELNVWTRPSESLVLMPSVAYLEVREDSDELFIFGLFGSMEGEVTINGVPTLVSHWTEDVVAVQLPTEGPGSAGDVIVKVRGHESNAVPLTEWRGEMRYIFVAQLPAPDLRTEVVIQAHFRADVHPYREAPGKPPKERQDVHFVLAGDSTAEWQMTGHSSLGGATFDLEGGGVLPLEKQQPDHNGGHFGMIGTLDTGGVLQGNPPQIAGLDVHVHTSGDPTEGKLKISGIGVSHPSDRRVVRLDASVGTRL